MTSRSEPPTPSDAELVDRMVRGDTTYRLTNITRVEPPPHLFEIPPDFTIAEPDARRDVIIERKLKN